MMNDRERMLAYYWLPSRRTRRRVARGRWSDRVRRFLFRRMLQGGDTWLLALAICWILSGILGTARAQSTDTNLASGNDSVNGSAVDHEDRETVIAVKAPRAANHVSDDALSQSSDSNTHTVTLDGVPFSIPIGFTLEKVAGSDLAPRPIVADLAPDGRLYVADSSGTNDSVKKQLQDKPHRLLCLIDEDRDGTFDTQRVFADRLMFPEGVLWHRGSVYVAAPPQIWRFTDRDGDGIAEDRDVWFDGKTLTGCANDLHGPYLGRDGWIYWCKGAFAQQQHELTSGKQLSTRAAHIFRRRPSGGPIEVVMSGGMDNPVEVAIRPDGERFFTTTFLQHPAGGRRDGLIHAIYGGLYGKSHGVLDGHVRTGPDLMPVMTHMGPAAPSGLTCLDMSGAIGKRGDLVSTAFNLHRVVRHRLVAEGASFRTQDLTLVDTTSLDFHPTDVIEDADGSLLVVDTGGWYKLCCPTSQLHKPDVLGAIYRLRRTGFSPPDDPYARTIDDQSSVGRFVSHLGDPRPFAQRRAIDLLAARGSEVVERLADVVDTSPSEVARRNAIWTLCRIEGKASRVATRAGLQDLSSTVRQASLHTVALHRDQGALRHVIALLSDANAAVQRAAAEAAGRIGDPAAIAGLVDASVRSTGRVLRHSQIYALIEIGDLSALRNQWALRPAASILIARDQLADPQLTAADVIPLLTEANRPLARAAQWITARHPEWNDRLFVTHRDELMQSPPTELPQPLRDALVAAVVVPKTQVDLAGLLPEHAANVTPILAAAQPDRLAPALQQKIGATLKKDRLSAASRKRLLETLVRVEQPVTDEALVATLQELAADTSLSVPTRLLAVGSLRQGGLALPDALFDQLLNQARTDPDPSQRRNAAVAIGNARLNASQWRRLLDQLPELGPVSLVDVLQALRFADDVEVAQRVLVRLEDVPAVAVVPAASLRLAFQHLDTSLRSQVSDLLKRRQQPVKDAAAELERLLAELPPGNVRRGQAVFHSPKAACFSCHAMGYRGGDVGPDLTRIGKIRSKRDLLEAIAFPSLSFVRSYESVTVETTEGQVVQGVVRDETDDELLLVDAQRQQIRVPVAQIERRSPSPVSIMPSGLTQLLSRQDLADLVAFLQAAR